MIQRCKIVILSVSSRSTPSRCTAFWHTGSETRRSPRTSSATRSSASSSRAVAYNARKGSERTWIYTIALNCLRDHLRRSKAEGRALERAAGSEGGFGDERFGDVHERDELMRALGSLETQEREIVALRYGADLRLDDIAAVTGLPSTTVQGRLYSGLRKLRDTLEPERASPSQSRST